MTDIERKDNVEFVENNGSDIEASKSPLPIEDVALIPVDGLQMTLEEAKLNRRVNLKMDFFMLPVLVILYLFNGMDRGNVGNAATVTFLRDAHLSKNAVNNASSLFFATFVPFQPISATIGKAVGVTRWLPICMFCWGILTIAHAYIHNNGMFYAFRLLIGVFEAGFYPMAVFFLSTCYTRFSLALRIALFYGSYNIAGAFSGLIAYGILQLKNTKLHSWQYLFIIEGSITMGLSLFAFFYLPREGCKAWFLTQEEKHWAAERMLRDSGDANQAAPGVSRTDIVEAIKDWKLWVIVPSNIFAGLQGQAFTVFLPLIVQQLGYASYHANLFAVPIYVIGAVGLYIFAFSSDHFRERTIHIQVALLIVILGLILASQLTSPKARYAALCIMNIGNYATTPLVASSLLNNTPRPGARAVMIAIQGWGNLAGVPASELFRSSFAPRYQTPFYVSLGCVIVSWFGYLSYRLLLLWANKWRARKLATMSFEEIEDENHNTTRLGDKKYTFVYTT